MRSSPLAARELASCYVAWDDWKDKLAVLDWNALPFKAASLLREHQWIGDSLLDQYKAVVVADVHAMHVAEVNLLQLVFNSHPSVVYTACPHKVRRGWYGRPS